MRKWLYIYFTITMLLSSWTQAGSFDTNAWEDQSEDDLENWDEIHADEIQDQQLFDDWLDGNFQTGT